MWHLNMMKPANHISVSWFSLLFPSIRVGHLFIFRFIALLSEDSCELYSFVLLVLSVYVWKRLHVYVYVNYFNSQMC